MRCFVVLLVVGLLGFGEAPAQDTSAIQGAPGVPDAIWVRYYYDTFDRVAEAAGLQPLRTKTLPQGGREVRVWIGVSTGSPKNLYRFVERGGTVNGELIRYWHAENDPEELPGETFHDLMLYSLKGSCEDFRKKADMWVCRALFKDGPEWKSVLQRAGNAGLWTLSDPSTLPDDGSIVIDGWSITVELLDGKEYRAYQYSSPDVQDAQPEVQQAAKVADIVREVSERMRRPDAHRNYRGITTGAYRSPFHLCESEKTWGFRRDLEHLAEKQGITLPEPGPAGYEVEVIAEATPKWLARQWESEYPRELQVSELVSVRPAQDSTCTEAADEPR